MITQKVCTVKRRKTGKEKISPRRVAPLKLDLVGTNVTRKSHITPITRDNTVRETTPFILAGINGNIIRSVIPVPVYLDLATRPSTRDQGEKNRRERKRKLREKINDDEIGNDDDEIDQNGDG